ncbi:catalase family peroxidase [Pseudomonas sp. PP3]|uniref:catalase family peroxidase n=1 Tax=Pseudomonas sp. PP3 TaxID=2815936 RepID=UPI001BAF1159|nr:catalase family peroxidase [Pseudomonas sp. PP3]
MYENDIPQLKKSPLSKAAMAVRFVAIGAILVISLSAMGYVNGLFDAKRLTPERVVNALERNAGLHPGYRRNHPKGVCVVGYFESNGLVATLSKAQVFRPGRIPIIGRLALPTGDPFSPDNAIPVRSFAIQFTQPDGQQWRTGMNSMPVFPVGTPQAFVDLLIATSPDPKTGKVDPSKPAAFFAAHPEAQPFLAWVQNAKPSASYVTQAYNSLNAFFLVDAQGHKQAVRWTLVPQSSVAGEAPTQVDYLEQDLNEELKSGPKRWSLVFTLANPGDPANDASKQWQGDHQTLDAGTLVIDRDMPQIEGDCRDINFDPLMLPEGIEGSDDPLLAARSAAYARSYLRRTSEVSALQVPQAQEHQQ